MLLTHQELVRIAKLAHIAVASDEISLLQQELNTIFSLIGTLQAANTDGVEPMAHPQDILLRLRQDVVTEYNQRDTFQSIAPQVEAGFFLVPKVIE